MTICGALVLRPEPGNARTAARLAAAGVDVLRQPLFAVTPVAWALPDPAAYDALLLTSANAVRHAGPGLAGLSHLPVLAVGEATAAAARAAGMAVAMTGSSDAAALVGAARRFGRLLHLAGQDRIAVAGVDAITVYRSETLPLPRGTARGWTDRVALLHSVRAARRLAMLVDRDGVARTTLAIAALSPAVRDAAGEGWAAIAVADHPTDAALIARATALIDPPRNDVDKRER